ncbi:MAG TPA: hypothetical protein VFF13_03195 [archaeon]|nr:hypothetical protein [archaeon]
MLIRIPRHLQTKRVQDRNPLVNLRATRGFNDNPHLPYVGIFAKGRRIGFCTRGHRKIAQAHRGKGYFEQALAHLEEIEKHIFEEGFFEEYTQILIEELITNTPYARFETRNARNAISTQIEKAHIDFTTLPEIRERMIGEGYRTHKSTIDFLRRMGFKGNAAEAEISKFIIDNKSKLKDKAVYLLIKPIKQN